MTFSAKMALCIAAFQCQKVYAGTNIFTATLNLQGYNGKRFRHLVEEILKEIPKDASGGFEPQFIVLAFQEVYEPKGTVKALVNLVRTSQYSEEMNEFLTSELQKRSYSQIEACRHETAVKILTKSL